ncbi:MAG: glycosyltransferase [Bacteroidetes bacterium]|nr:glycosyltransferase [Bacteroidota bacterium]
MRILFIGNTWRGANDGSLFRSLSKSGYIIELIETNRFFPLNYSFFLKVVERLIYQIRLNEFNSYIIKTAIKSKSEVAIIYKGAEIFPETISKLKKMGIYTVNFYPDVSFFTHGALLAKSICLYDLIVSTKSFAKKDLLTNDIKSIVEFIPHGFDTEIHKPIKFEKSKIPNIYISDCVFIGQQSTSKANYIMNILTTIPTIDFKVWGNGWDNSIINKNYIVGNAVFGDYYALALQCSKISLGLLSEKVPGASSGDLITARTFEIPGTGAFMIHERTDEIHNYFEEDKEIVCFETNEELTDKVKYYLNHDSERDQIAKKGKFRAWKDHTYEKRAEQLIKIISNYI